MVKNKDRWSALSMKERADLINMYITNGISELKEMKRHYNSFAPGGSIETDEYGYPADITPAVVEADYPRENEIWKRVDASNADMVQRLRQGSSRATIQDWEDPRKVATHKMMSAGKYAVGNVQNINGQLFDFTDPKHGFKDPDRAAIDSAIKRGDYVEFDTEGDARYFAEHYKKHYNSFGPGGDINSADGENKTIPESEVVNTSNYRQQIETYNQLRQAATDAYNSYDWRKLNMLRDNADSLGKEIAKYTLNEYSQYPSSPLNYGNWAGTITAGEPQDITYLLKSNIREDGKEVTDWLKSYVNSEGFQRIRENQKNWWDNRHPYRKHLYFLKDDRRKINDYVNNVNQLIDKTHNFVLDGYPRMSFAQPFFGRTFTFKRTIGDDEEFPFHETQMHEVDHLFNMPSVHYGTINAEVLDQNTNTKKNNHDEYRDEKHADNIAIKYLLFKEGIYDARSDKDVTPEQIQQLREKYPKLRFLQQLNNEEAAFQINNVAQNTSDKDRLDYINPENIAANGGDLNVFDIGGDTDGDGNIVLDWIRKQLYDKIDPVGYNQFVDRVKAAILGKGEDKYNKVRDDIFATYLKIPKDERHDVEESKKVSNATYTPTKSSEDTNYHKIDLTDKEKDALIYDALRSNANVGDSSRSHVFEQFFGPHQVSRGKDEKGEYVSYYDLWDLDPSSGESKTGEFEFLKSLQKILGAKDMSLGVGEPVEFYDRIYLNDYYGVTPQIDEGVTEGGYLQPAYIEASAVTGSTLTGEDYYNAGEKSLPIYNKGGKLNNFSGGGNSKDDEEPTYLGELETAVVKPKPMYGYLNTHYPVISEYPFTGHSELQIVDFGMDAPITITKYGSDYDYNLVTNNCSDGTRRAIEQIFGEKINPVLFTTPGDVQDFVAKKIGEKPYKVATGVTSLDFEVPFATAMDLKNQEIDFLIQDYLYKAEEEKKKRQKEDPKWDSSDFDEAVKKVVEHYEQLKYKFQPFVSGYEIDENGNYIKADGGRINRFDIGGDTNTPNKTKEQIAVELQSKSRNELLSLQQTLADAGYYDQTLQLGKDDSAFRVQDFLISKGLLTTNDRDGSIGENTIKALQTFLVNEKYLPRHTETGYDNIDGKLGNTTQNAYNAYLRKSNVDGFYGDNTLNAYYDYLNQNNTSAQQKNNFNLSKDEFFKYIKTPIRQQTWQSKGFKGWTDEDLLYLYNQLPTTGWDPRALMYAIDRETNFMPYAKSPISSAIGLAQLTKDQLKQLYRESYENLSEEELLNRVNKAYNSYRDKTRSVRDIIDDTILQYSWMRNRIKTEPENMGYGRIKVNLLAPNARLDDIVPKYVYEGSLTKDQQSKIKLGKATYRDLMMMYDEEFKNKFNL